MVNRIRLYVTAIDVLLKGKVSPEKAFNIACKKLGIFNSRDELYKEFLRILRNFYYNSELYGDEGLESIVIYSLKYDNITLPKWVRERISYLRLKDFSPLFKKSRWIRVNTLKANTQEVISSLEGKGFKLVRDYYDFLFKVLYHPYSISKTDEFKSGKVVMQDKASIEVVRVLDPKPGERILEVGSAPGMKTSLIQQLTQNKAYVIALDISEKRIKVQKELMERLGVDNVELLLGDGENLPIREVDKVLIDAPCSNSGTLNTDPSIFLRLSKGDVIRLSKIQRKILEEAYKLRKLTVYSTCSMFPDEGEKVVEKFANFLVKINDDPSHYGSFRSRVWLRVMRFYPHLHGTEGFFIAKLDFSKSLKR